jgi:hypothetical protein
MAGSNGTMTMPMTLSPPTQDQAAHYTRELEYDERFAGYLFKATGQMVVTVYSLEQALAFLGTDNTESTVQEGQQFLGHNVDVAYMQPKALVGWIREAIGDVELADAIEVAVAEAPEDKGYPPQLRAMRELMSERFLQYMDALGIDLETRDDANADAEPGEGEGQEPS